MLLMAIQILFKIVDDAKKKYIFFDLSGRNITIKLDTRRRIIIVWEFLSIRIPQTGIIFWIVDKIKILFQLIFSIIMKSQLWNGIIPILIHKAVVNTVACIEFSNISELESMIIIVLK